ncbi:cuticlin-3 [Sabethes cyaneus]|uniref:cuticlin-3 n=1 Tax=Sabethes cyaneus TaxID=53552 RepID=UPI00237E4F34|nr:cuticlin-3 [Sabethes cyaneus]XP_053688969.1 cuticlin-3 [Sabethes cyaneus]XP_053688970.1 cuticlin-3 [Sabethes cyaneus]
MELRSIALVLFQLATITTFTRCAQIPSIKRSATIFTKEPTVRIQCLSGSMLITIKDAPANLNGQFSGMVYPKGLAKNSTCLTEYRNQEGALRYKLPLKSCNTMPIETDDGGIEFFNTIVLQPHLKLVTDLGRGYHVRCRYKSREAAMKPTKPYDDNRPLALTSAEGGSDRRDYGRSLDKDHTAPEEDVEVKPMPGCHMKIFTGEKLAENVKIGDPLTLVINIDKQELYGLHVTDCLVRDGLGWGEQKLVNEEGCPLDNEILGPFDYTDDRSKATVTFPAHKFPYTTSVYYQCNVRLCALDDPDCHKPPSCTGNMKQRQKRETEDEGLPATIEVFSGLYVNENAEVISDDADSVFREKTPDDAICVSQRSFAVAIAIAGLCLMLAVVLAVMCIVARRSNKTISNSGSSIYSGPYTNTAFSHSS